ncbi:MAG: hypothetical protein V4463_25335, partial [Pseudomonadota bacterium]
LAPLTMRRALLVAAAPPAALSLRLFATAPVFVMLAALVLLWAGPAALAQRWSPALLAATHLFALGALSMAMAAALWQLLPVVCGVALPCPQAGARCIHACLGSGAVLLAAAFLGGWPALFLPAAALLVLGLCCLLGCCLPALWRMPPTAPAQVVWAMRLALLALLAAVTLGATLAWGLARGLPLPFPALTDTHVLWAGAGWVGMLTVAVSFQVVPMFQVTPLYPALPARSLAPLILCALLLQSALLLALVFCAFAALTLRLLWQRKRAPEATTWFWVLGLASLLAAAVSWSLVRSPVLLGVLFLYGFAWSIVTGMLYKIVPFLLWHAWAMQGLDKPVARIGVLMPARQARLQLALHAAALLLLALAALYPAWTRAAGVMLYAAAAMLWHQIAQARAASPK